MLGAQEKGRPTMEQPRTFQSSSTFTGSVSTDLRLPRNRKPPQWAAIWLIWWLSSSPAFWARNP